VVAAFFSVCAFTVASRSLAVASAALIGATVGFLIYNYHPAKVFMGDTGSLFLGGMVVGSAFMLNNPLIVLIFGLIFVIETLSVILQVASFKLTGKRIFKMSPIHHHFEKCGWSEVKIVSVFSFVTLLCCVLAWFGI
jgi:phospho-N-acetylmuramoyl-pentapeptide-transferase